MSKQKHKVLHLQNGERETRSCSFLISRWRVASKHTRSACLLLCLVLPRLLETHSKFPEAEGKGVVVCLASGWALHENRVHADKSLEHCFSLTLHSHSLTSLDVAVFFSK